MKTNSITPASCLLRLQTLCARSEQCEHKLRDKMRQWGISSADADDIIGSLRSDGFIDDGRFARAYTLDKLRYNHWGREKIRFMLRTLHVDADAVDAALEEIDEDEYEGIRQSLIERKEHELNEKDEYVRRAKLRQFLFSRGFTDN